MSENDDWQSPSSKPPLNKPILIRYKDVVTAGYYDKQDGWCAYGDIELDQSLVRGWREQNLL